MVRSLLLFLCLLFALIDGYLAARCDGVARFTWLSFCAMNLLSAGLLAQRMLRSEDDEAG